MKRPFALHLFAALVLLVASIGHLSASESTKSYRRSFINHYPRFKAYHDGGDPGEPLYLTPLIESQKLEEARKKAEVIGTQFHSVKSYAGYLTVNKHFNSNMFFWYFPAVVDSSYVPVILWLQGGPGASSLFGLFTENGPFMFVGDKLHLREYSWNKDHNLIYIDNPVGTGFSFTDNEEGYATNERQVAQNLYEALKQLFVLFDLSSNKFWITGESYAGKYVPALAFYIHEKQNSVKTDVHINLQGVAIGNGLSDPLHQLNYGDYLYQLGLIDLNGHELFQKAEEQGIDCIHKNDMKCAFKVFDSLINMDDSPEGSLFHNLTGYETYFNYLKTKPDDGDKVLGEFLQSSLTRRAIHVGNKTFHDLEGENKVEKHLINDIMTSVAVWVANILQYYKVCIYSGQLDIIVAYPLTLNYLQHLKFKDADTYKIAQRKIWMVDGEVAGYKKTAGNLVEVLVRNAGHMAPMDQPKWVLNLITSLTLNKL